MTQEKNRSFQLVECPRDAMQGWLKPISTEKKIEYLNALLRVGFDTLDFGSFVSAKAVPQMADTAAVVSKLDLSQTNTRLLAIVANERGAEEALAFEQISFLGFPFSVSETFQRRNANSSIAESLTRVEEIHSICQKKGKKLVIYISMGFGNPYGDPYSEELVFHWVDKMVSLGIGIISLADTVGLAGPAQVFSITDYLIRKFPDQQIGVHLHSRPENWRPKIDAAIRAGCKRFDGALKGIGGCPMAGDELVGNMNSVFMIPYFQSLGTLPPMNEEALQRSVAIASEIFEH
jgi:hydroxymethylglutaryl-CoA lyase